MSEQKNVTERIKLTVTGVSGDGEPGWICIGDTITFDRRLFEPLSRWERFKWDWKRLKAKIINR
jgi:hypothetical protein